MTPFEAWKAAPIAPCQKPAIGDRVFVAGLGFGFVRGELADALWAIEVPAVKGLVHIRQCEFFPAPVDFGAPCHVSLEVGRA